MALPRLDLSGRKILVVEDNETSRYYYEAALKKSNATTLWAKNGLEAVSFFERNPDVELVLMDLNMPEMDGFEATRLIKKLNPNVPIIVQSAFILSGEEMKSFEAGCDEFLAKPIRLNQLLEIIEKYLK